MCVCVCVSASLSLSLRAAASFGVYAAPLCHHRRASAPADWQPQVVADESGPPMLMNRPLIAEPLAL